jgi:hypothetical protein
MTRERERSSLAEAVVHALLTGDVLTLQRLVSPDVVDHSAQAGQPTGWAGLRERSMTLCAAMPEGDVTVDILSSVEDTVLARAELVAVRRDTGAPVGPFTRVTVALVLRFQGDLLSEMWTSADLVLDRPLGTADTAPLPAPARQQERRARAQNA